MLEHRYLLAPEVKDVARLTYWALRTNSLVFVEKTPFGTLPDYFLKPWLHSVPIAPGLTDLRETFEFCQSDPGFCQRIMAQAQAAARRMHDSRTWQEAELKILDRPGLRKCGSAQPRS
ncbi:hypothetical protein [Falsigemmobacter faecalis]|uniref:Glycosyl transferase CAP10 domain-containing protein n=1 Tax=Falsigemmobacter faecalis TaxID=2488730 RepID=A0A3P3DWW1_9RHOB|nr:hypothetical protein [Falsigemmobacter faecalis]RRH78256.1 hypothetical protein EG244_02090 [Falsigemmobacter faecalis]